MKKNYSKHLWILIVISTLIRVILAATTELGNDEVYYRLYALYPDWSHFDHPPMIGWMMWIFSLGLTFTSELAFRMSPIVFAAINTFLIFQIGKEIKNERTGWFAALLYTASVYAFIIAGTFIMPDAPQSLFWLLSLWILTRVFSEKYNFEQQKKYLLLAGLFIGLAFISKYTSIFLWLGAGLYILFFDRKWLKTKELWISGIITIICMLPVLIWNLQNDFISFTFHAERVDSQGTPFRIDYLLTEIAGEFLYNNPVNFILLFIVVVAFLRKKIFIDRHMGRLLLCVGMPVILLFWFFACFRSTLPHWSGPAFVSLIPLCAAWLDEKQQSQRLFNTWNTLGLSLIFVGLSLAVFHIHTGLIFPDKIHTEAEDLGEYDFSLDLYGWHQAGKGFGEIRQKAIANGEMPAVAPIVSYRWFPAANQDYYIAEPNNTHVLVIGDLERIHKFAWINQARGGFQEGMDMWYVTSSHDFSPPQDHFSEYFETIGEPVMIPIYRCGKVVENFFVYQLHNLKQLPKDNLIN